MSYSKSEKHSVVPMDSSQPRLVRVCCADVNTFFSPPNRQAWVKTVKPRRRKMSFTPDSHISPLKIIYLGGNKCSGFESPKRRFSPFSSFFQSSAVIRIHLEGRFAGDLFHSWLVLAKRTESWGCH
ncbi:hypothetical protein CDAR_550031 [Caerostris darwini]|uniref:Uncharacterized protein n=1 Tax=Caerostris darwini TaxID=1538125 RepID=A0AAV4PLH0_9ARAC|nr:hypothetical protein CDAR_550031 [Caerostris darwini]